MKADDLRRFSAEMMALSELYNRDMSETLLELYFEALRQYPIQEIVGAVRVHIKHRDQGQFFPKPADLIRLIEGDTQTQAMLAWDTAVKAMMEIGQYTSVKFDDSILGKVIHEMGGWPEFYDWPDKEMPFKKKEFMDRYRAYAGRGGVEDPGPLLGLYGKANIETGFPVAPHVLIGAPERKAIGENTGQGSNQITEGG